MYLYTSCSTYQSRRQLWEGVDVLAGVPRSDNPAHFKLPLAAVHVNRPLHSSRSKHSSLQSFNEAVTKRRFPADDPAAKTCQRQSLAGKAGKAHVGGKAHDLQLVENRLPSVSPSKTSSNCTGGDAAGNRKG